MVTPAKCQPLIDELEELKLEKAGLQEELKNTAGNLKWSILAQIQKTNAKITAKTKALDLCIKGLPNYETDVVIIDLSNSLALPATGTLWKNQTAIETETVQGGRIVFNRPGEILSASIGISIQDASNPTFTGPLFRSGSLQRLPDGSPGNPKGFIEIVIPASIRIVSATLIASLPSTPIVRPEGTINSIELDFATLPGTITITLGITGSSRGCLPITASFTYALNFILAPSFSMSNTREICVVVPTGAGTITGAGLAGIFLPPESDIRTNVVAAIQGMINSAILTEAEKVYGGTFPTGVVLSLRRVSIAPSGITFFPALGAFGGVPVPPPPP